MLSPLLSRKKVCSPNSSLSCETAGWSSGMAWASNWLKVLSTCVGVNFIACSFVLDLRDKATRHRVLRGASHVEVVKRHRSSAHPAETHVGCPAVWSTEDSKRQRPAPRAVRPEHVAPDTCDSSRSRCWKQALGIVRVIDNARNPPAW